MMMILPERPVVESLVSLVDIAAARTLATSVVQMLHMVPSRAEQGCWCHWSSWARCRYLDHDHDIEHTTRSQAVCVWGVLHALKVPTRTRSTFVCTGALADEIKNISQPVPAFAGRLDAFSNNLG